MATKMSRTPSGAPSAAERKKTGGGDGLKAGSFPVFDAHSAESALALRGHGNKAAVEAKVEAWANKMHNVTVENDVKKARAADKH